MVKAVTFGAREKNFIGGARASQKMLVNLGCWIVSCGVLAFKKHFYLDDLEIFANSTRLSWKE